MVICALVGFIVGGVFYYLTNLTFVLAGGALGYITGTILIGLIAIKFTALWLSIGLYIVMIGLGLLLGHYLHDFVVVLTTSVFGGFLMIFAAGSAIGNYPSYMTLSEQFKYKRIETVPVTVFVYFGFTLVLSILCFVV
jgi:hypothetical protein